MKYVNDKKLYVYYIKDEYEALCGEVLPIVNNIFAYTPNKKVAKLFEEQRNMKLFRKDKQKMTSREYNDFLKFMVENDDRYLDVREFTFYDEDGNKVVKDMAISKIEERRIIGRRMNLEINISTYCWYSPEIFNDEIYDALKVLKYNQLNNFIGSGGKLLSINKYCNTIADIININELELVIDVIGGTLAK